MAKRKTFDDSAAEQDSVEEDSQEESSSEDVYLLVSCANHLLIPT